jgi:hypothetical protein
VDLPALNKDLDQQPLALRLTPLPINVLLGIFVKQEPQKPLPLRTRPATQQSLLMEHATKTSARQDIIVAQVRQPLPLAHQVSSVVV